jgi:hypothetical protein
VDWLKTEIATGLQRLLCLGLEGQPAAEVLPGTVAAWFEALTRGKAFDRTRDTARIRDAFSLLLSRSRRWPAPADFLEVLPKYEAPVVRALPVSREEQERRDAMAREVLANVKRVIG